MVSLNFNHQKELVMTLPKYEGSFRQVYRKYKHRSKLRGIIFNLGPATFRELAEKDCTYCGSSPTVTKEHLNIFNGAWPWNGIDRIDNTLGYEYGNVHTCCGVCNQLKSDLKEEDFISHIKSIFHNLEGSITED